MFKGILIQMFHREGERHFLPHMHARYGEYKASFSIQDGTLLAGEIPPRQKRLIQEWIALRREELMADWNSAVNGATLKPIEPLK
jgi:hypothetical protein